MADTDLLPGSRPNEAPEEIVESIIAAIDVSLKTA